jgi:biopolymer transport protein ExbB/TolQ
MIASFPSRITMTATRPARRSSSPVAQFLTSGWLWGTALAVGFYAALPYLPIYRAEAQRYFTAHWIEYATTWLFFVGMATLFRKSLRIPGERTALRADVLDGLTSRVAQPAAETADQIEQHLRLVARQLDDSIVVRRIREVCDYVRARCSASGLEAHLTYLAELGSSRLHESYALIRTITWAVPILGFLGTVIGITMAIANVTPDQLSSSLNEVTAGLAVAFDTTALSLALSMLLVFTTFVVERAEQSHHDQLEDYLVQRLTALFPAEERSPNTLFDVEAEAAGRWLQETERLIHAQQAEWQQTLSDVRHRWCETLESQQRLLADSLQAATGQTLLDHARQLADLKDHWSEKLQQGSATLAARWEDVQRQWQAEQAAARQDLVDIWAGFREELQASAAVHSNHAERLTAGLQSSVSGWQADLRAATAGAVDCLTELRRHGELLEHLAGQEAELMRLEERLTKSLESARVAQSLEETVLNLNAAVHLLTARAMPKAA